MAFAPPVGFNLTFSCPDKQVFESDWFAMPFVMMTCQVRMWIIFRYFKINVVKISVAVKGYSFKKKLLI
jgi:hypothetical protein